MTIEILHQQFLDSTGICTDTRTEVKDTIFVALRGEHFDGNRFVESALEKGCSLAVCEREEMEGNPRVWVVPSALETLQQLARFHRMQLDPKVLAITGSNGKTTTKELVASILERKYRVGYTRGNLNNHIGVPLTLLKLTDEEVAVVEMGANHPGEIAALCGIAAPGLGIITNVGKAHLEGFGSLEGVLDAKGELYDYLASHGGTAIIDGTDEKLLKKAAGAGVSILTVGPDGTRPSNVQENLPGNPDQNRPGNPDQNLPGDPVQYGREQKAMNLPVACRILRQTPFLEIELEVGEVRLTVPTRLVGAYNLQNILLAAGVGLHFEVPVKEIAAAIAWYEPNNSRSQFVEGKRNRVIMDAYNANPSSMREAIGGLMAYGEPPLMLILGEMAEMGDVSEQEHRELVRWLGTLPVERILLVGKRFQGIPETGPGSELSERITVVDGKEGLERYLGSEPPAGYDILVKGSRVNELERILPLL